MVLAGWAVALSLFLLRAQLLRLLPIELVNASAFHLRIEHFQGAAAGIDFIVMGQIGEAFENPEQLVVPQAAQDLDVAGPALRAERPKARQLIATFWCWQHGETAERAHQVKRLALAGLARILANTDADLFAVLRGGIEQQSLDVTRIGAPTHHIEQVIASGCIAAELDADGPVWIVELVLFGGREIPITDDVEVGRGVGRQRHTTRA